MGSILISQEFQVNAPIFLILLLMFLVMLFCIIYKFIQERKKKNVEHALEVLFRNLNTNGDFTMNGQDIVDAALAGTSKTASGTGRQQDIATLLGSGLQSLMHQSTGLVQTGRRLALAQALRDEMKVGSEMVAGMHAAAEAESNVLTVESLDHVQIALGGAPSDQEEALASPQPQLQSNDNLEWAREIVRKTAYLAQEARTQLGGNALNVAFDFTPELKTALREKLRQQCRSGALSNDLQKLFEFLEQQ